MTPIVPTANPSPANQAHSAILAVNDPSRERARECPVSFSSERAGCRDSRAPQCLRTQLTGSLTLALVIRSTNVPIASSSAIALSRPNADAVCSRAADGTHDGEASTLGTLLQSRPSGFVAQASASIVWGSEAEVPAGARGVDYVPRPSWMEQSRSGATSGLLVLTSARAAAVRASPSDR